MKLVNFLNDLFKEDGFRLIDANKREYLIGKPEKKKSFNIRIIRLIYAL
ncbi:hypothetical protein OA523_01070 [Candidatus Pelagibacter sp.]|nr:hypothetical protein [Candidatus Pelagibacter sp.]